MTVQLCPAWCGLTDIDSVHHHGQVTTLCLSSGVTVRVGSLMLAGTGYVQIRVGIGRGPSCGRELTCAQAEPVIAALLAAHTVAQYPAGAMPCDLDDDTGHTTCVHWVPVAAPGLCSHEVPVVRVERPRRRWARPRIAFTPGNTRALYRLTRAETDRLAEALTTAHDDADRPTTPSPEEVAA